jgi:hypothetical protein
MSIIGQDVRHALARLRANPVVTASAVLTLALGIAANLAIYRVLDVVLFRELPVRDASGLVQVQLLAVIAGAFGVLAQALSYVNRGRSGELLARTACGATRSDGSAAPGPAAY